VKRAVISSAVLLVWGLMLAGGLVVLTGIAIGLAGAWVLERESSRWP
jgi:hypothetical protein